MACPFCQKEHAYSVEEALDRLARGPLLVREALAGAGDRELDFAEPKPGGWNPAQVATHLMDTEIVYSLRLRKLLAEDDPPLPAFDENLWNAALQGGRELVDTVEAFELLRKQNVGLVRSAPPGALDRSGRHPEYGALTLRQIVLHLAEHDAQHAAQIRRVRDAYRKAAAHA